MSLLKNKSVLLGGGIVGLVVVAYLAFGVFGVQTLFIDDEVSEENPFAVATESSDADSTDGDGETSEPDESASDAEDSDESGADESPESEVDETPVAEPEIVTVAAGDFVDGDHPTSGVASVITDGTTSFLRFEEFVSDNGPDLNVYLRNPNDENDYIDLGDLKGNIGDQNYELAADIDVSVYSVVDIWCVRFGVSFGTAAIS